MGVDALPISVEAHVANGLPAVTIVGPLLHQQNHERQVMMNRLLEGFEDKLAAK